MVIAVFDAMQADPVRLLPREELLKFEQASGDLRIICDYVAAMTNTHLLKTYERLSSPEWVPCSMASKLISPKDVNRIRIADELGKGSQAMRTAC